MPIYETKIGNFNLHENFLALIQIYFIKDEVFYNNED